MRCWNCPKFQNRWLVLYELFGALDDVFGLRPQHESCSILLEVSVSTNFVSFGQVLHLIWFLEVRARVHATLGFRFCRQFLSGQNETLGDRSSFRSKHMNCRQLFDVSLAVDFVQFGYVYDLLWIVEVGSVFWNSGSWQFCRLKCYAWYHYLAVWIRLRPKHEKVS